MLRSQKKKIKCKRNYIIFLSNKIHSNINLILRITLRSLKKLNVNETIIFYFDVKFIFMFI